MEWTEKEEELVKQFDKELEDGAKPLISFSNSDDAIEWLKQL